MKGISTIIAAIILVVITIGLIATAYLYFAGIVAVGPVLAIASGYCDDANMIHITLRNDGTAAFTTDNLIWLKDGATVSPVTCSPSGSIAAADTTACNFTGTDGTVHNIQAIGPRNQASGPITC